MQRVNPGARYAAMEEHFDALGCAGSGQAMMSATAALQVNLDAGPAAGWEQRLALVRAMVPMLVALSATSPYLGGRSSGWHSMRQGTWQGIDHARSDPFSVGEPAAAWAFYALSAPVMLVRDGTSMVPVRDRVSFAQWLQGDGPVARPPGVADLDYHLTTLFPPVRPRGYVEIRCIDALPDRWWPALAALTATLVDDPVAADLAAELCAPVADDWEAAARSGTAAPAVRRAVLGCLDVAARRCPPPLKVEVEELAELFDSGAHPQRRGAPTGRGRRTAPCVRGGSPCLSRHPTRRPRPRGRARPHPPPDRVRRRRADHPAQRADEPAGLGPRPHRAAGGPLAAARRQRRLPRACCRPRSRSCTTPSSTRVRSG